MSDQYVLDVLTDLRHLFGDDISQCEADVFGRVSQLYTGAQIDGIRAEGQKLADAIARFGGRLDCPEYLREALREWKAEHPGSREPISSVAFPPQDRETE